MNVIFFIWYCTTVNNNTYTSIIADVMESGDVADPTGRERSDECEPVHQGLAHCRDVQQVTPERMVRIRLE
jgi:hypothetical protein